MGLKIGKIWGTTECLLKTPLIEVHLLHIKPHSQCSLHKHLYKWNAFLVQSGTLIIEVTKNNYPLVDKTVLHSGEMTTVQPGELHRFLTGDAATVAIEIYYPEELSEDIERINCGSSGVS